MMCETVVIGSGVIGLAIARGLAMSGREVLILEECSTFGSITSSRNSSVIHAGIYYAKNSLKAQCCVAGRNQLYHYLSEHNIEHNQCGKIIVATSESELSILDIIIKKAENNGVFNLTRLSSEDVQHLEPEISSVGGIFSPSTGIVDSHSYMNALLGDFEDNRGMVAYSTSVVGGHQHSNGVMELDIMNKDNNTMTQLSARQVINASGLNALDLTRNLISKGDTTSTATGTRTGNNTINTFDNTNMEAYKSLEKYDQYYAKGNYFSLAGKSPFKHLIYPVPVPGGLGVHATLDLGGQVRFGPDVEWINDCTDYDVDVRRADTFYKDIRKYYPNLQDDSLTADYSGIRPKLYPQGKEASDFVLWDGSQYGMESLFSCLGMESPGLTSSLAVADRVVEWSNRTGT